MQSAVDTNNRTDLAQYIIFSRRDCGLRVGLSSRL
nr:MAG TPA_asm: hypothetical protein [Caudoviricetes sp.]